MYVSARTQHSTYSELLHGFNVDGLDELVPFKDLVEDIVSLYEVILDDHTDLEHLHAVGNGDKVDLLVPDEANGVDFGENLSGEGLKVFLLVEDLDVENDNGLSDGFLLVLVGFLLLGNSLESLLLSESFSFSILLLIGAEKIDVFSLSNWSDDSGDLLKVDSELRVLG